MTQEQEDAAKGRIVNDYTATKSRFAALKAEAHQAMSELQRLADRISNYETASPDYDVSFLSRLNYKGLITDLQETTKRLAHLQQQVRDMGII